MTQDAPSALRALFAGYADMFDRLAAQDLRFWTRRALTRRFLTGHVRTTVTELECTLHRQAAVDGDSTLRRPLLDDLEHFRAALDPAFSTFARTLIGLAIVLVAQLLGRLPLVPIVSGPARKPALGSLNDAVAVDPGHVAKAIADLLGSPPSTICGALATVAAAGFLVLGPCIPALRAQRRLLRDSVDGLEADAFTALGGSPPHRRRLDLLIWWCLPVFAISLGLAWYAAYLHGLMRATPGNAGRHNAVDVVIRTDRPLLLGLGGFLLGLAGLAMAVVLAVREPESWPGRIARAPRTVHQRALALGCAAVAVGALAAAGTLATVEIPGLHDYRDPRLEVLTSRLRLASLVARPVVPLTLYCRPDRCEVSRVRIREIDARAPVDRFAPVIDVSVENPPRGEAELLQRPVTAIREMETLGLKLGWFHRKLHWPRKRITPERSELVERAVAQHALAERPAFGETAVSLDPPLQAVPGAVDVQTFEIALGDADLRRLLADLGRPERARAPWIELSVRMAGRRAHDVVLPLRVRL